MNNDNTVLSVQQVSVCFTQKAGWFDFQPQAFYALQNVSLQLRRGRILAVVGESGSGKTTLARCIAGLIKPSSGAIHLPMSAIQNNAHRIQYVFQDPYASLNPGMTVAEAILEPLSYQQPRPDKARQSALLKDIFELVGLDYHQRHRYPHEFSGGQCQRIAIARALISQPEILISDEPVSALDVSVRAQVINLLRELNQTAHLSQIFIAHDLGLTRYLSHDVVVLYQGQVMEAGPCRAVFDTPRHPYTRALIAAIPYADPRKERQRQRPETRPAMEPVTQGCTYAARCPRSQPRCLASRPKLDGGSGQHAVACFYPVDD